METEEERSVAEFQLKNNDGSWNREKVQFRHIFDMLIKSGARAKSLHELQEDCVELKTDTKDGKEF